MSLWPFRQGNDGRFQHSVTKAQERTIYDSIQNDLPHAAYDVELRKYMRWRWQRGLVPSVLPTTLYSSLFGLCLGLFQSRSEGRYTGRAYVLGRYTASFALVGLAVGAVHHGLVVHNNYEDSYLYPVIAGVAGTSMMASMASVAMLAQGVLGGAIYGVLYGIGCLAGSYIRTRQLRLFLRRQQQLEVPVHRVSPELQPMYRAYLYDYRPLEERSQRVREARAFAHGENTARLDAQTMLQHMTPEICEWVSFPDWWPLRWGALTEEDQMIAERQEEEEAMRCTRVLLTEEQQHSTLRHRIRAAGHRD